MIQGYVHPDFQAVGDLLRSQLRATPAGGAAVCVYHRGERVVDIWGGVRDALRMPWQEDTMSVSFSTTKGVTATALHFLVDNGVVDTHPVSPHLFPAEAIQHAWIEVTANAPIGQLTTNKAAIDSFELLQAIGNPVEFITSAEPGVEVAKSCNEVVYAGEPFDYTIFLRNDTTNEDTSLTVTDTLPAALLNATWSVSGSTGGATSTTSSGTGNISDTVNLPVGGSITYTLTATIRGGEPRRAVFYAVQAARPPAPA